MRKASKYGNDKMMNDMESIDEKRNLNSADIMSERQPLRNHRLNIYGNKGNPLDDQAP